MSILAERTHLAASVTGRKEYAAVVGMALVVGADAGRAAAWTAEGWRYGAVIADIERDHAKTRDDQARVTATAAEAA